MTEAPFVPIGRIAKAHGLKGEISVVTPDAPPHALREGLSVWVVPPPQEPTEYSIEWVRPGPKGPLVKLSGVSAREPAARLAGRTVVARRSDLPEEWGYIVDDDIGLRVLDTERGDLGRVEDVIVTGANDVWVVRGSEHGEVLIPVIEDVVLDIDDDSRTATVRLLPGLVD